MAAASARALPLLLCILLCFHSPPHPPPPPRADFLRCLSASVPSHLLFTPSSPSFASVLSSSVRNPRLLTPTTARPLCIVTATNASHAQSSSSAAARHGVPPSAVRSGGHDYEGLSYRSVRPEEFAVLDLAGLRAVRVDSGDDTAWVDSGATLGELYYTIAKNNPGVAFPAGICPTIGVGGHLSGGGIGMMMRKFGLAVDNVLDAKLVNADGDLVDRAAMGEDLFWAIRGGGGGNFGIVVSWKVNLVKVPSTVTAFNIGRTVGQGAIDVLTRWQDVGPTLPNDINIRVIIQGQQVTFQSLYLGSCSDLVPMLSTLFRSSA
ncbi:hypothetical protein HU200_013653 [Digitaria exilis]|uniref:FAD-binding PCMH-type domain-containing protein n=1 Tax=Digitaria exilis TaxID=1010633 RepID=A0A835FDJ2_9POAL|nr:hypothetical protein HU200_013653 [Digitaria exilis]